MKSELLELKSKCRADGGLLTERNSNNNINVIYTKCNGKQRNNCVCTFQCLKIDMTVMRAGMKYPNGLILDGCAATSMFSTCLVNCTYSSTFVGIY